MGWFEGRVAVVTGAASGLGRAVAERIAAEGGAVVVADIAGDRAHETAAAIEADGGRASGFAVDVSEEAQVAAMVQHARRDIRPARRVAQQRGGARARR